MEQQRHQTGEAVNDPYCVIDQSATENKVIHTLIIDFFSHGLRSVKIEQELEKYRFSQPLYRPFSLSFERLLRILSPWLQNDMDVSNI